MIQWIRHKIETYLLSKGHVKHALKLFENENLVLGYIHDIDLATETFNRERGRLDESLYINARHLNEIFSQNLPTYTQAINKLKNDKNVTQQVFLELRDSSYFTVSLRN